MLELFQHAGIVAWPLGLCSVLALGIILERAFTLARIAKLETEACNALQTARSEGERFAAAPVARVIAALSSAKGGGEDSALQVIDIAVAQQRLRLRRYLGTLATIGSTAPFIGLFGTVLGVMAAFQGMSKRGLSGETMAAGISEALSATALGLLVAIPSVMAYNYYVGRVQTLMLQIQADVARLRPLLSVAATSDNHREESPVALATKGGGVNA